MKKQIIITLVLGLAIIAALGGIKFLQISRAIAEGKSRPQPPISVTSAQAKLQSWAHTVESIGSLTPVRGATLAAESAGRVQRIAFTSGSFVEAGTVLVELDANVEEAKLRGALAETEWAKLQLERAQALRSRNANSLADLQETQARHINAAALAEALRAELRQKKIVAPFSGYAGINLVTEGQYVTSGTPIVSLQSYSELFLDLNLPQQYVAAIQKNQVIEFTVDAYQDRKFAAQVTATDPSVDIENRTFKVRSLVRNPDEALRPGMFCKAQLTLGEEKQYVTIPSASVNYAPYGNSLYVIESYTQGDPGVFDFRQQMITLGPSRGDQVAVLSGVKAGEHVVSSGTFKLRPGEKVQVNNSVQVSDDHQPNPADS